MLSASVDELVLTDAEIRRITGCKRAADQVEELLRQGFHRARRARDGSVVLERAHYLAVCAALPNAANEPRLQP